MRWMWTRVVLLASRIGVAVVGRGGRRCVFGRIRGLGSGFPCLYIVLDMVGGNPMSCLRTDYQLIRQVRRKVNQQPAKPTSDIHDFDILGQVSRADEVHL